MTNRKKAAKLSDAVNVGPAPQWTKIHAKVRKELNMIEDEKPWSSRPNVRLLGVPESPRMRDLIDIAAKALISLTPDVPCMAALSGCFVDLNPGADRHPWSYGLNTLTTKSQIYSFTFDRMLTRQDMFACMGFGPVALEGRVPDAQNPGNSRRRVLTRHECIDLTGEAMHTAAAAAFMYAIAVRVPFEGLFDYDVQDIGDGVATHTHDVSQEYRTPTAP